MLSSGSGSGSDSGACALNFYVGILLLCLIVPNSCTSESKQPSPSPTKLVHDVCIKVASYYSFCVDSLYSDSRTPTADRFVLAYVSFDLAYLNATHTNNSISNLLLLSTSLELQKCQTYYVKAIRALASAINDLNSDTFFELGHQAVKADHAARDCEATFDGQGNSLLSPMNFNLRALSNICLVISTLFTASPT